ncbi:hypothetical protein L1987_18921 [Smallanthus sonchifolius]|uniref:Uncharacterized protein n=1 Tax=Smallanthus sonchifolius TaxID=185202 RepID=A0ACB9J1W4_9ASTR|nr:hypothetical protein L1987_18921 [Smallanthus sonchifolius]
MLSDSKLPVTFWAEAVNTTFHILNRVLTVKKHNKMWYLLLNNRKPNLNYLFPFGNPCTLLKTRDVLTKFSGKLIEGIFLGYVVNSRNKRVFNEESRQIEELFNIDCDNRTVPQDAKGPSWAFDCDALFRSFNISLAVSPVEAENLYQSCCNNDSIVEPRSVIPIMVTPAVDPHVASTSGTTQDSDSEDDEIIVDTGMMETCLNACFISQTEPKNVAEALDEDCWIEAIQEELAQFDKLHVWHLVDLPKGSRSIGTRWVFKCKRDDRGVVVHNNTRLVFQLDVKSAFLYGKVKEEVYVKQPPGFEDHKFPDKVFKLDKALYGLHQAPRAWYETLSVHLLENGFERGQIDSALFIRKAGGDILLIQKYEMSDTSALSTPIPVNHKLDSDSKGKEVDYRLYRGMIGSLMYLTVSRPDIMFAICLCLRFQSKPKESHLIAVKRIFRYLKGKPRLGLWYPNNSDFDFKAFTDSDYGGCGLDRKSTSGGCQFLGNRLVSWQCKKQTSVAISTCEAEYIAAASCCSQILWIQQQLRDYSLNFTETPMFIDNTSTMSITNNPMRH